MSDEQAREIAELLGVPVREVKLNAVDVESATD